MRVFDRVPVVSSWTELQLIVVGFVVLLATSGLVVGVALGYVREDDEQNERRKRAGWVIGKTENVLVFTFVLADAFTALAVVFAAKGIVTRDGDDDQAYSQLILVGTLVNFTYSVLIGGLVRVGLRLL